MLFNSASPFPLMPPAASTCVARWLHQYRPHQSASHLRRHANFEEYLVPVNADVPDIQVISVGIPDMQASTLGNKGIGEIGVVGVAPAIGNTGATQRESEFEACRAHWEKLV
ncbi:hypothetical protein [Pigmentiphaga aceris]|uniref:hypothetical protein n=1 Tax=Pigmentiphaga aceris TaxID=1940612 RepID=UPI001CA385E5|nr:hypothetical protein [Pigmentiphaga aceris]